jgi:hypothetical protein
MEYFEPNFIYSILIKVISIIFLIIVILLVFLLMNTVYYNNKEQKRKKLFTRYIEVISGYLTGEPVEIEKLNSGFEFEVFAEVADHTMLDFSKEQTQIIHFLLDRLEVIDYLKKRAASYFSITRHNAIEILGYLKMPSIKIFLMDRLGKEPVQKNQVKILIALSFIADWQILNLITQKLTLLLNRENIISVKLVEHIYTNIIKSLKTKNMMVQFMEFFSSMKNSELVPGLIKKNIMDAAGSMGLKEATMVLIDYYYSSRDIEIKAAGVRNLGLIGAPEGRKVIIDAMQSESWVLRLVGAKAALICGPGAKHNLRALLSDPHYKVRINSAKTLALLGNEGKEVLLNEINSKDNFVRDTVKFVLDMKLANIY